jgi:plastocyanin
MKYFSTIVVLIFTSLAVGAGTILGNVRAEGKPGAGADAAHTGNYGKLKYKFAEKVDYAAMHDFVVYIEGSFDTNSVSATNTMEVTTTRIAQKGAIFSPHILPVMVGTKVEWPNNDDIYHNVFSMSDTKQFDLDLYKGNPPDKFVIFDKPGRVDVFCSIHSNMHCIVLVLPNPYFAATDENGNFKISNVPPGTYKLKAWCERVPADEQEIIVPAEREVHADFTLSIKNLPKN